ncbi:MAG: type IV secretory system conjugative DNA transfer family protein [Lachnospiraceae bacterium]|nr:type IV secretory system conjugative DNA transfer family protein [Lachnospiraceae bacterium]
MSKFQEIREKSKNGEYKLLTNIKKYIKQFNKRERKKILIQLLITLVLSVFVSGLIYQLGRISSHKQSNIYIALLFTDGLNSIKRLLITFVVMVLMLLYIKFMRYKPVEKDDRNFNRSTTNVYGSAQKMSDESFEQTFNSKPVEKTLENIIGINPDIPNEVISLKRGIRGLNDHKMVMGCSGSRKTRSRVIPDIMQYIARGESFIVTDPKGEVYQKTSKLARLKGHDVKVLNLKPSELECSDGIHILKYVGNNQMKAQTIAEIIIRNTSKDKREDNYFTPGAKSLLTAAILYTTMNEDLKPEERTFGEMYRMLVKNSPMQLSQIFKSLPIEHPARLAFLTFDSGTDAGKSSIHQGLLIRLQALQNPTFQKILSTDEISLTECGDRPCAYYIVTSDQESTLDFGTALFFNLFFIEIVAHADKQRGQRLKVLVNVEMDEMPSIGPIPDMQRKTATVRSRGIILTFVCQNQEQIEEIYPNKVWKTIMSNCSTQILLAVNDDETAETFSKRSGEMTVDVEMHRYMEHKLDPIKIHPELMINQGLGRRRVYTPDELLTMDDNKEFVVIQGRYATMLDKFDYTQHPYAKYVIEEDSPEYMASLPSSHVPEWRKKEILEQEKRSAAIHQSVNTQAKEPANNHASNEPTRRNGYRSLASLMEEYK